MQETLVNIIDNRAKSDPEALYAEVPKSPTSFDEGYTKISYRTFADAINGAAWWLQETLGCRSSDFETLAYVGPNDLRYNVFILAAVKAGYKVQ